MLTEERANSNLKQPPNRQGVADWREALRDDLYSRWLLRSDRVRKPQPTPFLETALQFHLSAHHVEQLRLLGCALRPVVAQGRYVLHRVPKLGHPFHAQTTGFRLLLYRHAALDLHRDAILRLEGPIQTTGYRLVTYGQAALNFGIYRCIKIRSNVGLVLPSRKTTCRFLVVLVLIQQRDAMEQPVLRDLHGSLEGTVAVEG